MLVNYDTILKKIAIKNLFKIFITVLQQHSKLSICVGSTKESITGITSYGGRKLFSPERVKNYIIQDNETFAECDLDNANIMLVPREISQQIGMLSSSYTHGIADYDYTLTAKKNGFPVVVAPGTLGFCEDDHGKSWKSQSTSLKDRIKYLYSHKGLAYKEYLYFIKTHFPSHYYEVVSKL